MTILAGFFSSVRDPDLEARLRHDILAGLGRNPRLKPRVSARAGFFLAKVDIGSHIGAAWHEDGDEVAALFGHPHLDTAGADYRDRDVDLREFLDGLRGDRLPAVMDRATGTFGLVRFSDRDRSLCLLTDVLGLWPIYIHQTQSLIVFSNQLRLMAGLSGLGFSANCLGLYQVATIGYTVGTLTTIDEVERLPPGVLMRRAGNETRKATVGTIHQGLRSTISKDEHAQSLYRLFMRAIRRRMRPDMVEDLAFLSGGLDSRLVVAGLRNLDRKVRSICIEDPGLLDEVLAKEAARAAGSAHLSLPSTIADNVPFVEALTPEIRERCRLGSGTALRIWGGDGGSGPLAGVKHSAEMIEMGENQHFSKLGSAIVMRKKDRCSLYILDRRLRTSHRDTTIKMISEELNEYCLIGDARVHMLFLLLNHQREHLHKFYEEIDETGIDQIMPFYDIIFMREVLAGDPRWYLGHRFYYQFLRQFPPWVANTPWQAYPGHEPCPLPLPEAIDQWEHARRRDDSHRREVLRLFASNLHELDGLPPLFLPPAVMARLLPLLMRFTSAFDRRVLWLRRYMDAMRPLTDRGR